MTVSDMHTRAMLVSLRISAWSARKYDRKISAETAAAHGATIDAGRYNKHLMPADAKSYKELTSHIASTRVRHYEQTLAWSDDGWRLLPVRNYDKYTDTLRKDQHTFDALLHTFLADYPTLRESARVMLNGMYQESDYPRNLGDRYSFGIEFNPVPTGGDFRVSLSQEEITAISARTEERVKQAFADAQQDAVKRLFDVVRKMHAKLMEPDAIFRDSLITNVRETVDVLSRLNLADDPELERLRRETELLATVSEPETLRKNQDVRIETANRAQSILDAMNATYGSTMFA